MKKRRYLLPSVLISKTNQSLRKFFQGRTGLTMCCWVFRHNRKKGDLISPFFAPSKQRSDAQRCEIQYAGIVLQAQLCNMVTRD